MIFDTNWLRYTKWRWSSGRSGGPLLEVVEVIVPNRTKKKSKKIENKNTHEPR